MKFETNWTIEPAGKFAEKYPNKVIVAKLENRGYYVWMTFASQIWEVGRMDFPPARPQKMVIIPEVTRNSMFTDLWYADHKDVPQWTAMKGATSAAVWDELFDEDKQQTS